MVIKKQLHCLLLVRFSGQLGCERDSASFTKSGAPCKTEIDVSNLQSRPVIGELGHPLGTVVTIEGRFKDMTFTRVKADVGGIVMIVEAVNGNPLDGPKRFDFTQPFWDERKLKPKDSERFRIIGYEAGAFFGPVEGESEVEGNWAARTFEPFEFRSRFHDASDGNRKHNYYGVIVDHAQHTRHPLGKTVRVARVG